MKPWRKIASNDVDGWWGNWKRTATARLFEPAAPHSVTTSNTAQGAVELKRFLRQLGVKRETIIEQTNRFIASSYGERQQLVREIITLAADEIDHPILKYGLLQSIDRAGVRSFSMIEGKEAGIVASRSRKGTYCGCPVLPSHLSDQVDLPGPEFQRMLGRYRTAGRLESGKFGSVVAGWGKTNKQRAALAARYRKMLHDRGLDVGLEGLTDSDFLKMAYATVSKHGADSGLGKVSKVLDQQKHIYSAFHSMFTRAQLALRPITWAFRVAILEEGFRGAFFEMPTMYRNPFRFAEATIDAHRVATLAVRKTDQIGLIGKVVDSVVPAGRINDVAIASINNSFPGFRAFIGDTVPTSRRHLRAQLASFFQAQVPDMDNIKGVGQSARVARALKKNAKKIETGEKTLEKYGLLSQFDFQDLDINNKGFTSMVMDQMSSDVHHVTWQTGGMNIRQLGVYADVYQKTLWTHANDPMGRIGLARVRAAALGQAPPPKATAAAVVQSGSWRKMRSNIKAIGLEKGWDVTDDVALAQRYLDEIIDPLTESTFAALWRDNLDDKARIAGEILDTKSATAKIGGTDIELVFDSAAPGRGRTAAYDLVTLLQDDADSQLPAALAGRLDFRFGIDDDGSWIPKTWKNVTDTIMQYGGEKVTQVVNRRPAWLAQHADYFKYYKKLGMTDDLARQLASEQATEIVNFVYYNMDNATPFLKAMNKVFPFFSAMWEVSQTWAYKIPMSKGGIVGVPMMFHKVDRVLDGLRNTGVLQYDVDFNDRKKVHTTSAYLTFANDPEQWGVTGAGSVISKAGYEMLKARPHWSNN